MPNDAPLGVDSRKNKKGQYDSQNNFSEIFQNATWGFFLNVQHL